MVRRSRVVALLAVAAAAALLGVLWPLEASGHTARTLDSKMFTDPSGDNRVGGPDLTTVQISDDSSGTITFAATIANRPSLTDVDAVQAFFDTDRNTGTGGNGGFEYEVAWITGHQELAKWDGSQFATL